MAGKRPPYTSKADLERLFDRMRTLADPGTIDSKWVESYGLAASQPPAVLSVLKWLGVVDESGVSAGVWNDLRVLSTRPEVLRGLIETAYSDIFARIDLATATRQDIDGAFISAYRSGNTDRPVGCFLALCEQAGIETGTTSAARNVAVGSAPKRERREGGKRRSPVLGRVPREAGDPSVVLQLNVEVAAEWSEDQVRERIKTVRDALAA